MEKMHDSLSPKMQWLVEDATDMKSLQDGDFEVVLEKGTYDAIEGDKGAVVFSRGK